MWVLSTGRRLHRTTNSHEGVGVVSRDTHQRQPKGRLCYLRVRSREACLHDTTQTVLVQSFLSAPHPTKSKHEITTPEEEPRRGFRGEEEGGNFFLSFFLSFGSFLSFLSLFLWGEEGGEKGGGEEEEMGALPVLPCSALLYSAELDSLRVPVVLRAGAWNFSHEGDCSW